MSLIETLRKYPEMMSQEGIFRKAGSVEEEDEIINSLPSLTKVGTLKMPETDMYSGYAIAGVIKKFFTSLEIPIVPYRIYNKVISLDKIKEEEEIDVVRNLIFEIPPFNRKIILYMINFLRTEIVPNETTKMNFHGMSVVFSPCFFRAETLSVQDLFNSGKFAGILKILFYNYEKIIGKEEENKMEKRGSKESKGSRGSRGSKGNSLQPLNSNHL